MNIGSISITPSTTQEYTLYSTNASGQAYSTIAIIMPTAPMAAPVFIPPSGEYPAATKVAILAPTETSTNYCISNCSGNGVYTTATIYYTTNGSTPTTSSSVFSDAETANGSGNGAGDISVTPPETVEAIIVTQIDGTPYTSTVGTAVYTTGAAAAATPTFSPVAGSYNTSQSVTISSTTPSSTIYYTTDTTLPTYPISGTTQLYSGPITVSSSENIEAIAVASGDATSAVGSAGYTFNPAAPTFNPIAGSYTGAQSVTISDATVGATIYYTVTSGSVGTTPTTSSAVYTGAITVTAPSVIDALAVSTGYASTVSTAKYTFTAAAAPTFSPVAGAITSSTTISISDTTPGATIYYTVTGGATGTTPTTNSTVFSGTFTIPEASTVDALAVASGYANTVSTAKYTFSGGTATATPTFSPGTNNYTTTQAVTISDTTASSSIYYTTDGTTPTYPVGGTTTKYTGPVSVSATETIKAIATATGDNDSAVGSAVYTFPTAATPSFSPVANTYTTVQTVTISDTTPSSTIYYTVTAGTAGTTPTTSSSVYSSAITVSASEVVEAIAVAADYNNSTAGSAAYTINLPTVSHAGLQFWYRNVHHHPDGNHQRYNSSSTIITTPQTDRRRRPARRPTPVRLSVFPQHETLKAIATASGYSNSAVGSAAYTITAATPTFSPVAGTYSTDPDGNYQRHNPSSTIYYTTDGTTPTTSSSVYSSAIIVSATETLRQ